MTDLTIAERIRARQMKMSLLDMLEGIRVRNGLTEYPKAVMTEAMAAKGTAVINCGDEYTAMPGILALLSVLPMLKYNIVGEKKETISKTLAERRSIKE